MRYTYGVFVNDRWGLAYSARQVRHILRMFGDDRRRARVRRMRYSRESWDAPTFRVCSDDVTANFIRS